MHLSHYALYRPSFRNAKSCFPCSDPTRGITLPPPPQKNTSHKVESYLVLGCDEKQSAVAVALAKFTGRAETTFKTPASKRSIKAMNVPIRSAALICGSSVCSEDDKHTSIIVQGQWFDVVFPAVPLGSGRQFQISLLTGYALWDTKDAVTARNMLDENFPHLDLGEVISEEIIAEFVARPARSVGQVRTACEQGLRVGEGGT